MKKIIFILTWVSYTQEDGYLYSDVKTFTDENAARKQYHKDCENAYGECKWGSQWDTPEADRNEEWQHEVEENTMHMQEYHYSVSSTAYDGYEVHVKLIEKEIEF